MSVWYCTGVVLMFQSCTAAEHGRELVMVQQHRGQGERKNIRLFKLPQLVAGAKSSNSVIDKDDLSGRGDAAMPKKHETTKLNPITSLPTKDDHLYVESKGHRVQRWWKLFRLQIKKKTIRSSVPYESLGGPSESVDQDGQLPVYVFSSTFSDSCESLISTETSWALRTHRLRRRWWWKLFLSRLKVNITFGSTVAEDEWSESGNSTDEQSYVNSLPYTRLHETDDSIVNVKPEHEMVKGQKQHARREEKKISKLRRPFKLPHVIAGAKSAKSVINKDDFPGRKGAATLEKLDTPEVSVFSPGTRKGTTKRSRKLSQLQIKKTTKNIIPYELLVGSSESLVADCDDAEPQKQKDVRL